MPELPEIETIKNDLAKTIVGAKIVDFWSNSPKQIIPGVETVKETVVGGKIAGVERRGKLIVISIKYKVKSKNYLGIHLKMSGRLLLRRKNDPPDLYCRAIFFIRLSRQFLSTLRYSANYSNDKFELRFCDTRRFGYIRIFRDKDELGKVIEQKLGPEPFAKEFTLEYLQKKFKNKNSAVKTLLMDQSIIAGVGNIYVNEALFLAGIRPHKKAGKLGIKELRRLRISAIAILKKGIKHRGSTGSDGGYKDLFGEAGNYQNHFLVYEQKGKPCPNGCGSIIQYQKLNGRGTFWCEKCQN